MFDAIIRLSLNKRSAVLLIAAGLLIGGGLLAFRLPVDVFPDLNRPRVTVLAEAHGLAPEEVEVLVTIPLESALNGAPGLMEMRSSTAAGIAILYLEFGWGSDIHRCRQAVAERLQLARERLPREVSPTMGPITSIMGEIQFIGLSTTGTGTSLMDLRALADWTLRPRLMAIPGISQVVVMGGQVKQYQIMVSSGKLLRRGITLEALRESLGRISANATGGFIDLDDREYLIRPLGALEGIDDIRAAPVGWHLGQPVFVRDVAEVRIGPQFRRGEASVNGRHSVVLMILKSPDGDTIQLTGKVDEALQDLATNLPEGVVLHADLFKQARFIEAAIGNVVAALRDGSVIVGIILVLFLANGRTAFITLTALPLSLLATCVVFAALGLGVNTMTLGGLAIAVGELVDDAIVDVENVFRRLKNRARGPRAPSALAVVFAASSEIRNSIVLATLVVILVFLPLFALSGIEGRLFQPLGIAYIVALGASLLVALTVTPVLCLLLLPDAPATARHADSRVVAWLKRVQMAALTRTLHRPRALLAGAAALFAVSLALIPFMGRNFLPPFNEGTATIGVGAAPGISLAASDDLGRRIEEAMLTIPEVVSTVRRTGRAEMDEHAEGVHWSEIDVDFREEGRPRAVVLAELREKILAQGDVYVNVGQPISHRLDHMLSGVRAQIAVKIFGPDLGRLRRAAAESERALKEIPGLVDLAIEPLVLVPQLKIAVNRPEAGKHGLPSGALAEELETALNGEVVARILEGQRAVDVFVRLDDASRKDAAAIGRILLRTLPSGHRVPVADVATVYPGTGANQINRENQQRRIVVSANTAGRDLGSVVAEVRRALAAKVTLPPGYFIELGGQFESQQRATRLLLLLGVVSLLAIGGILHAHFRSGVLAAQVMLSVPLALTGGLIGLFLTERVMSVATLIGFITLCGIATRNAIMQLTHYLHLVREEREPFGEKMIVRGTLERLSPVLMTALCASLALLPLLLARGEPGKELLYPVAVVIVSGLISSTLLDRLVTPALFLRFGRNAALRYAGAGSRTGARATGSPRSAGGRVRTILDRITRRFTMRRLKMLLAVAATAGLTGGVMAHDEGHGPKLTDAPKMGGVLTAVVKAADAKLGPKAVAVHKAELVRNDDGSVEVFVYDLAMNQLPASQLGGTAMAKLIVEAGGKTTVTPFKLTLKDGVFTGKSPKPRAKPYNIDVHFQTGKGKTVAKLLAAFDGLD